MGFFPANHGMLLIFFPEEYWKRKVTLSTPILFFNSIRPSSYLNSQEVNQNSKGPVYTDSLHLIMQ